MTVIEKLRKFIRKIDLSRVSFSFKYMDEDKYTTLLGGFVSIIFLILGLTLFIINFIPFCNHLNFTLQDYIVNTHETEEINLKDSPMAFAIGFDCPTDSKTNIRAEDLLYIKLSFITYTKDKNGNRNKSIVEIKTHPCNHSDFHNEHNKSFDLLNIDKLQCLDKKEDKNDTKLEGIYTDEKFTYYEFSLMAKENTAENYKKIDDYLIENDCKLQFYYTDLTLNMSNYKEPIKSYINSLFLQINPTLFLKMNVFFMNYHLNNDTTLIQLKNGNIEEEPLLKTGFSRAEQYFLYKGLDRFSKKPYNYNKYANLYIRVDNKKIEIKRKYQNLLEFYADNSSLLISLYVLINFIIRIYNAFKANLSISRRLFFDEKRQNQKYIKLLIKKDKVKLKKKNENNIINNNEIINFEQICETEKQFIDQEENKEPFENKKSKNKLSFSSIYYFCSKEKRDWYNKANIILDNRLDIFFYIRKMVLLELIIGDYFDDKIKEEINIKSRFFKYINYNENQNIKKYYEWSEHLDKFLNDFENIPNEMEENENTQNKSLESECIQNEKEENENIQNKNLENENKQNKNIEKEIIQNEKEENENKQNKNIEKENIQNEKEENENIHNKNLENENIQNEKEENKNKQNEKEENENIQNKNLENENIQNKKEENKNKENENIKSEKEENEGIENQNIGNKMIMYGGNLI